MKKFIKNHDRFQKEKINTLSTWQGNKCTTHSSYYKQRQIFLLLK